MRPPEPFKLKLIAFAAPLRSVTRMVLKERPRLTPRAFFLRSGRAANLSAGSASDGRDHRQADGRGKDLRPERWLFATCQQSVTGPCQGGASLNVRALMTDRIRAFNRRQFLATSSAGLATLAGGLAKPSISRAADRPRITHGLQSGDVSAESAVVWTRSDRPARALLEAATTDSFKEVLYTAFVDALPESDFTAKMLLPNLPAGQDIVYRLTLQNLAEPTVGGEPMVGRFRTAPADRRSVSFCWSGDTAGQGWGIDEARGGMRIYDTMLKNRPDFFIHSGDNIYADGAILPEQKMPNGEIWRNLVTEEKSNPPKHSRSSGATTNTTSWIKTSWPSHARSLCWRNGTTTRSRTTGGPRSHLREPSTCARSTPSRTP